ncbi:50S ribosomal protein L29 [Rubinisphaera italica]|uniref:Large ribosomal subunit protein uL29 n=1 Tax=Rubinisphaera italica TaxID=2527969 RepID=A0A5C5XIU5_9PLAN|nr:50S ribosomal protein L29 [Rubinisphaera italica]TWT63087.1 50S ribosomal protein L29 [Rubinisphaera italica]|tara:strand:+ start:227 stop:439 length:213 start_codon:yes stop_codon:yes gene_type:complete
MSKASELREQNDEQLGFSLKETQKEFFQLQFKAVTEKLDTPSRKKELRREIARIKTIQNERLAAVESSDS